MKNVLALFLFMSTLHGQTPLDPLIDSLILRSRTFTDEQDFDPALESGIQAEKIALEKYGKESVAYGNTSFNHGRVLYFQKIYEEAEYWYLESKTIREKVLGKAHPDYGKSVNNLAIVYDEMGLYEKAEPLYLEVLALRESLFGKESDPYADVLSNLASLYMQMGQYEKSESLSLEAKDIRERVLGKSAPDYASSLINLANLYYVMHNYKQAELLYQEAIAIRENVGDKESVDYILGLGNLGVLYQITGQYDKAQPLLIEARNLAQKNLGESQPIFVLSLNHLANLYKDMQDFPKAEAFFLQAQALGEKILGKEHPDNILNQESLGVLYYESAQYAKAEPLLLECNALYAKVLGKAHPFFASNLDFLAQLYWLSGKLDTANFYLAEAAKTKKLLLAKASRHLSEQELEAYIAQFADGLSRNCSFAAVHPGLNTVCYDDILFYKGFLLNSVSQLQKLALTHPDAAEKYNLLKSFQRRLAAEYTKPISERSNVAVLENQAGKLEKELVRNIAGYGAATNQFNWQDIQSKLQPEEAAIEFIHYKFRNPQAFALHKSMPPITDSIRYAALLLRSGAKEPVFIPLFEEHQLRTLLQTEGKPKQDFINNLYAVNTDSGESLYSLIWKPLEPSLNGVSTLYFSPSGLLHRLNLGAIPLSPVRGQETGATFAERFQLVELGSTRQLALSSTEKTNDQEALLYGGIRYEMDSTTSIQNISDLKDKSFTSRRGLDFSNTDTTYRGAQWNYLKWTEVEVRSIEALLTDAGMRPTLYNGHAATEESFKKIGRKTPSPHILHLATHGFFFPDPKHQNQATLHKEQEPVFKRSDHPMIRSGLILAGGNHAWTTGLPIKPGMEDGILTAYEISQMNLSNTELVVLSACETGLGDIQGNEGVYGLQRAFKIAGAKFLIMSLWQVPDFQTQELTTTFYSRWMDDKMTVPEAFRAAQKAMREKYKDPFWWAGFVLVE